MAESNYTLPEVAAKIKDVLQEKLAKFEVDVLEMRTRELTPKEGKLAKHELCPLCGGPDRNGICACLTKNAVQGYSPSTPGSAMPSAGPQSGGTQPMAMAETAFDKFKAAKQLKKNALCKMCGYEHVGDEHVKGRKMNKGETLSKEQISPSYAAKVGITGPHTRAKANYGDGPHDQRPAAHMGEYGKLNPRDMTPAVKGKFEKSGTTPHLDEVKPGLEKAAMPSSSAAALAPAAPKPATPVAHANQEMGGFKSLAHSPTAMPGGAGTMARPPAPGRRTISSMGRGSAAAAGTLGKSENQGSARSPYGTGGAGHASQKNMPSALKANMASVAKGEDKSIPMSTSAPAATVSGAKMPKAGKSVDTKKPGSGGEIKGNPLRKDGLAETKRVSGMQPVGQGGGDAHKTAATAGVAGQIKGTALPGPSGKKPGLPSVDVDVSEFDKGKANNALKAAGNAEVGRLAQAAAPKQLLHPAVAAQRQAAGQLNVNSTSDLKADRKAGGVGFLNALIQKFRPTPAINTNINPDGSPNRTPIKSQRFHGALPLQRDEKPTVKTEVPAPAEGLSSANHNRTMLKIK